MMVHPLHLQPRPILGMPCPILGMTRRPDNAVVFIGRRVVVVREKRRPVLPPRGRSIPNKNLLPIEMDLPVCPDGCDGIDLVCAEDCDILEVPNRNNGKIISVKKFDACAGVLHTLADVIRCFELLLMMIKGIMKGRQIIRNTSPVSIENSH